MSGIVWSTPVVIGILNVLFALFGLYYNASTFRTFRAGGFQMADSRPDMPYFEPAFKVMSAICVVCYLALALSGVQLVRGRLGWAYVTIATLVIESVYVLSVAVAWARMPPGMRMSVGGATGVSIGGLAPQLVVLYPIWGAVALMVALIRQGD